LNHTFTKEREAGIPFAFAFSFSVSVSVLDPCFVPKVRSEMGNLSACNTVNIANTKEARIKVV
jgi:hypothetical protein